MANKVPRYYWDTSIFLLLLKGEMAHGEDVLNGASDIFQATEQAEAIIVASEIVVAEVLESSHTSEIYDKWESALQWENLHLRAADHAVCVRAAKLRSDCLKKRPKVRIELADSIHVATFLIYSNGIDDLHSVDSDFTQALVYSGETRRPTVPRRLQTSLVGDLFPADELTEDEPDDLGVGSEDAIDIE